MSPLRRVLGIVVGVLIVLSAVAHSLIGGEAMRANLTAAHLPEDLLRGTLAGWHFGGAAMLAFGAIVLATFSRARGAREIELGPVRIVALAYLLFGAAGLVVSGFDPFFLVFFAPGALLALAAFPRVASNPQEPGPLPR